MDAPSETDSNSRVAHAVAVRSVVGASFDPHRFDHLTEPEVLRRIGELLSAALVRSGRLRAAPVATVGTSEISTVEPVLVWELIRDPVERKLVRFLQHAGPTSPHDLALALGVGRTSVTRKLRHLRAQGCCDVTGRTRAARYELRNDCSRN